jgi:GT2 family glycosyltransferase
MKLSVVIVNYNVQHFLEQCLLSVDKATKGLSSEVWVVDNNSVDGSVAMVQQKFPHVKLIANKENTGFSKANNQAMRLAMGEYVLLLNPDTLVEEDTFHKVVKFMDEHLDAGGLGVKMVDGKGVFLPESKRGLPTPETSFYKIFGISRLFPKSGKLNRYHLGHLSKDQTHQVEILSGAFMLMRKKTLDQVGLLDEAFFMYGEDIDLSWRIILGGWKNYYFHETCIIHYKGESTKKGSLNYVYVFYNAMVIFAKKHFSEKNAKSFSVFIQFAIWLRAAVAVLNRFVKRMLLPVIDVSLILISMFLIKRIYASSQHIIYDQDLVTYAFIVYALIWSLSAWIGGAYDKPLRPLKVLKPILIGTAIILIGYSLLPESLRFSRALILLGTAMALLLLFFDRILLNFLTTGSAGLGKSITRRIAIVGLHDEASRVKVILNQIQLDQAFITTVSPTATTNEGDLGTIEQLDEIVRIHEIGQVIYCARDVSPSAIIHSMSTVEDKSIEFKIAPPESLYIIGSGSIESGNDGFMLDVNSVSLGRNKRSKRIFDVALSFMLLLFFPLCLFIVKRPWGLLVNVFKVLLGYKSWVGYVKGTENAISEQSLPKLKPGVLNPLSAHPQSMKSIENVQKLNVLYAKDYRMLNDISIVLKGFKYLGSE